MKDSEHLQAFFFNGNIGKYKSGGFNFLFSLDKKIIYQ
jgi:hypothetical protein